MSIKRHFYNNSEYILDLKNKRVTLMPAFHQKLIEKKLWNKFGFKKIGGSSIGDVLEVDQWKSKFIAFCRISWINVPILNRKYVDAGIAIEPKVLEKIELKLKEKVKSFNPLDYNFDYFVDKDNVVGGIPDGLLENSKVLIEVKTTGYKNLEKWKQWGIPLAYHKQSQLYSYLMDLDEYVIVATFLHEEDYVDPQNYPIEKRITKLWKFKVEREKVYDDIKKIKDWYYTYTKSGISPEFDLIKDAEQIEYLKCTNKEEWIQLQKKWELEGKIPI